jgi:hypothetical protein
VNEWRGPSFPATHKPSRKAPTSLRDNLMITCIISRSSFSITNTPRAELSIQARKNRVSHHHLQLRTCRQWTGRSKGKKQGRRRFGSLDSSSLILGFSHSFRIEATAKSAADHGTCTVSMMNKTPLFRSLQFPAIWWSTVSTNTGFAEQASFVRFAYNYLLRACTCLVRVTR